MNDKDITLETAQKTPEIRREAMEFLLEMAVIAAQSKRDLGMPPMTILEMASAALQVLGVSDEELNAVTKKMVENRLAQFLGGGNVN